MNSDDLTIARSDAAAADLELLRGLVAATYEQAAADRGNDYIFPQGRTAALARGYTADELAHVPATALPGISCSNP